MFGISHAIGSWTFEHSSTPRRPAADATRHRRHRMAVGG
jgi:hypothetical protein